MPAGMFPKLTDRKRKIANEDITLMRGIDTGKRKDMIREHRTECNRFLVYSNEKTQQQRHCQLYQSFLLKESCNLY